MEKPVPPQFMDARAAHDAVWEERMERWRQDNAKANEAYKAQKGDRLAAWEGVLDDWRRQDEAMAAERKLMQMRHEQGEKDADARFYGQGWQLVDDPRDLGEDAPEEMKALPAPEDDIAEEEVPDAPKRRGR